MTLSSEDCDTWSNVKLTKPDFGFDTMSETIAVMSWNYGRTVRPRLSSVPHYTPDILRLTLQKCCPELDMVCHCGETVVALQILFESQSSKKECRHPSPLTYSVDLTRSNAASIPCILRIDVELSS